MDAPLTERRFLFQFPERVNALGYPEMAAGLETLVMPLPPKESNWEEWRNVWQHALTLAGQHKEYPLALDPIRHPYYTRAVEALYRDYPAAALWIMLRTWSQALLYLEDSADISASWENCLTQLGLWGDAFTEQMNALDLYLDKVEEITEKWAEQNGIDLNLLGNVD